MRHHPARLIAHKRDGGELSRDEIYDLISGVVDGSLGDVQLGAWLMAVCMSGMTVQETASLTLAMRDAGTVFDLRHLKQPKIDKHSTGGVGDKVSLLLAPMVAATGILVPMISGRGLGHTGGTIDKLEAIPGYRTNLSSAEFTSVLAQCGYVMSAATFDSAPADRRMYAARDISGTVESIPLITASILSKKLVAGSDGLVMDVKQGRAAFLKRAEDAEQLRESLVAIGKITGLRVSCWITDMDHPCGRGIGNALEIAEVIAALNGDGPSDLLELSLVLGADMLQLGGIETGLSSARSLLEKLLKDGVVKQVFRHNLELQGGDPRIVDEPDRLGRAKFVVPVLAANNGYVVDIDPLVLGNVITDLGGGRRKLSDTIDPLVGIVLAKEVGDPAAAGEVLAHVHASSQADADLALLRVRAAIRVGDTRRRRQLILARPY
ncbi:MAG: thymidine phosphorylase [Planctomycetes bacterium]|nr:thymidine phosphorylase [Planctomycetota bacterium]